MSLRMFMDWGFACRLGVRMRVIAGVREYFLSLLSGFIVTS